MTLQQRTGTDSGKIPATFRNPAGVRMNRDQFAVRHTNELLAKAKAPQGDRPPGEARIVVRWLPPSSLSRCHLLMTRDRRHGLEYAVAPNECVEQGGSDVQQNEREERERKVVVRIP